MMFMIMAMMVMLMVMVAMFIMHMAGFAMGGSVIMMIMSMMVVPVVVMSVMIMIMMAVIVIMALFAHRLVISAAIGLEWGFDMGHFAALGARHIFNHMIAANADAIGHDLCCDMAIA